MMAASLLETVAALGLGAMLLATLAGTLVVAIDVGRGGWDLYLRTANQRQVENLIDVAFGRAGAGPLGPPALHSARFDQVVLDADIDGDGRIDSSSAERTSFLLQRDGHGRTSLLHRIGRQSMTISTSLSPSATFSYTDTDGSPTLDPNRIRLVGIPIEGGLLLVNPAGSQRAPR